jgi:hypothetical protein
VRPARLRARLASALLWAGRQCRAFAGIAHDRQPNRSFDKLIAGGFALRPAWSEASVSAKCRPLERDGDRTSDVRREKSSERLEPCSTALG